METVTIHHRPNDPRSADLMLRLALLARAPFWPNVTPSQVGQLLVTK
jgi:hypothetical protein